MEPKVLVISNECFSKSSSNGRTLGNFFLGWTQNNLAQFYISSGEPDFDYCKNYFRITDEQVLVAFKSGRCSGGNVLNSKDAESNINNTVKKKRRNAMTMLVRNFIWGSYRWKNCGFEQWVREFNPDIILLQAGDFAFMFRLATRLAKKYHAKLVIFNSEGYYFKNFDYFRSVGIAKILYPLFIQDLKLALKKAYKNASYIFYVCDELKRAYDHIFSVPSETIYTASDIKVKVNNRYMESFVTSYCGNLGIDRHKSLIIVAEELQKISPEYYVDVYGKIPNDQVKADFDVCKGIHYHGLVSYEEVKKIIENSDLLLHVESFDKFYQEDLKFAFSTKIADMISSGKCFLVYAPEQLACSRYLIENEAAYVVSDKLKLKEILETIIKNIDSRQLYISQALELAKKNHDGKKNIQRFQKVLETI